MDNLYRLKHTLYPDIDGGLTCDKEEYDEESGYHIHRKGTLWKVCTKEEYCELENYDEDETEEFMEDFCDFDYVAYMKNNTGRYFLTNTLEDFERVEE